MWTSFSPSLCDMDLFYRLKLNNSELIEKLPTLEYTSLEKALAAKSNLGISYFPVHCVLAFSTRFKFNGGPFREGEGKQLSPAKPIIDFLWGPKLVISQVLTKWTILGGGVNYKPEEECFIVQFRATGLFCCPTLHNGIRLLYWKRSKQ